MKCNKHPARHRICAALVFAACVILFAGCTTIPKNGALLSAKLTEGIQRNQAETEKIITALADTQRAILREKWKSLYASVESAYMEKHGVADGSDLTHDQRRAIAVQSGNVWEKLRADIDAKEDELISQSRANTAVLVEMNESIQGYLLSVEKLDESRNAISGQMSRITGVDFTKLAGLADKLISEFNPNQP